MGDWRGVRCTAQEWCRPGEGAFQHGRAVYCVTVSLTRCVPSAEEALPLEAGGMARTDEPDAAFPLKEIRYHGPSRLNPRREVGQTSPAAWVNRDLCPNTCRGL